MEPNRSVEFQFGSFIDLTKVFDNGLNTKRYPAQSAAIHILLSLSTVKPTGWLHEIGMTYSVI